MDLYIVTGASSGVGASLSEMVIKDGHTAICLSRRVNERVLDVALSSSGHVEYSSLDFCDYEDVDLWAREMFGQLDVSEFENIYLVNNAGMVDPISTVSDIIARDIGKAFAVNVISLMSISNRFIEAFGELNKVKRILNISSGAATHPYEGWSVYCSTKAAVDMFTLCVSSEQKNKKYPVEITSFAPGIVDTSMQERIRNSSKEDFPLVEDFKGFKDNGKLRSPDQVANKIIEILNSSNYPNGKLVDISDY